MIARIIVTPKKSVLDPQGEAVRRAIHTLGMDCVTSTRVGKYIELEISGKDVAKTRAKLEEIARDLLSNPVVEDYVLELDGGGAPALIPAEAPAKGKEQPKGKEKPKGDATKKIDKKAPLKIVAKKVFKKK